MITTEVVPAPLSRQRVAADQRPLIPTLPRPCLVFLGWRIQRHRKPGTSRQYVYTYPARKAVKTLAGKVRRHCRSTGTNLPLDALLIPLNRLLRGWCAFFRPGVSSATFQYLSSYT